MSRPLSPFSIPALARSGGRRLMLPLLVAAFALLLAAGCGDDGPGDRANDPPTAELTASPVEGDTLNYRLRAFWTGADPDGFIVRYEYAVDPPAAFTEEEIADPTGSAGLQWRVIPGPGDNLDTLRVSKTEGGAVHSFDWVQTLAFNHEFAFSATTADSAMDGPVLRPTGRFHGMHAIYVRSVDDEGAASPPDRVAFTAETVAPVSWITKPIIQDRFLALGSRITVKWDGTDPDGADKPVGYLYRLLDLRSLGGGIPIIDAGTGVLFRKDGVDSLWRYVDADTLEHTFFMHVPGSYILGVRAVDAAGAVEPFLEFGRNAFRFQTQTFAAHPVLELSEPSLGVFSFKGSAAPFELQVIGGTPLFFQVNCSAEGYGGRCEAMRWGLNLADIESDEGWSDWGPIGPLPPITLSTLGPVPVQVLYVQVIDDEEAVTTGTLIFDVVDAPLDREVLFVDDARDQTYPGDAEHDAFWESLFNDSGRVDPSSGVDVYENYGLNDTYSRSPIPPTLAQLTRYRLVIWECTGDGYNGSSGLWQVATRNRHLATYLRAGGTAWIGGTLTVAAMLPSVGLGADFIYPKEILPGTFPHEFLTMASERVHNAKGGSTPGTSKDDNLIGVKPFPRQPEIYPAMDQDPNKINPFKGSISHGDAIFDPIFAQDIMGFTGALDSLYIYQAVKINRTFNNKLNAMRWHDPDPARTQGRVQWFGFPLYYMKKDQAQETFNRSIDWFREETGP